MPVQTIDIERTLYEFRAEKWGARCFSDPVFSNFDDYAKGRMVHEMHAYMYQRTLPVHTVSYEFERPTFLDWLLRRKRKFTVDIHANEVLMDPPKIFSHQVLVVWEHKVNEVKVTEEK